MNTGGLLLLLLITFVVMIVLKIPIAYSLGLSSVLVIAVMGLPITSAVNAMYSSVNSFSLLAVPLFMLLAQLMDKGGITDAFLKELSSKTNSTITLSDKAGDFDVGCILICGDCEYNGTLEARSDDLESDIRDAVNQALFSKK